MFGRIKAYVWEHRWLLGMSFLAAVVRLVYVIELSGKPGFTVPMVDERWHWEWAAQIIDGPFLGDEPFFRAPLYAYFLAFLRWLTDGSVLWTKLLQSLMAFGTAAFLFRLSRHMFDRSTAILATAIYALYGTLVFYETMFLIPILFLFLCVWGVYRLVVFKSSDRAGTWLLTGIVFGLAALARPNILIVVPVLVVWLYFSRRSLKSLARRALPPVLVLAGMMAAILPVTVRNYIVTGDAVLISSQGGVNLYLGNNEVANGLSMVMPEVDLDESISWRQFIPVTDEIARQEAGRELSSSEISAYWTGKAIDFITENPGQFLSLVARKTLFLLSGFENSDNADIYYQRTKSTLFSVLLWRLGLFMPYGLLIPLVAVGLYVTRSRWKDLSPIYLYLLAYVPSIVLFLVTARHRLPLVPFLIMIAAAGIVTFMRQRKKLPVKEAGIAAALLLVTAFAFNRTFFESGVTNLFQVYFNEGLKHDRLKQWAESEKAYKLAQQEYPYSAPLYNNLGWAQYQQGDTASAEFNYRRSLGVDSTYALAYNNLGLLVREKGQLDSSLGLFRKAIAHADTTQDDTELLARYLANLAATFEERGNIDSAGGAFLAAINAYPVTGDYFFKAAAFFARTEQYQYVDSLYVAGMRREELSPHDYFNWALSLLERRRISEAIGQMFRGLRSDPELYQGWYLIAVGYYQGEMPSDSVNHYLDLCLEINPTYRPALDLKRLLEQGKR